MKTKTNDRIKKYSAMAGAFIATSAVNAQIQYTDINPDQVVDGNNSPFMLDLDGDMVDDMMFSAGFVSGTYYGGLVSYSGNVAVASAANGIVGSSGSLGPLASNLSLGSVVSSGASFVSGSQVALAADLNLTGMISTNIQTGNFMGATDGYLGIAFDISGSTHYGWVRLDVASDASTITLKDYAYNGTADGAINAGQTVGLDNVPVEDKVNFKPMLDKALINVTPDLFGSEITLVDMTGRELSSTTIKDVNTTINYNGADAGIYMIVVKAAAGSVSKKVYVR